MACLVALGCTDTERPPGGGGGGGGGGSNGGGVDASISDGDAGSDLAGTVCGVLDVRDPLQCPTVDMSGIDLEIGSIQSITDEDGEFTFNLSPEDDYLVTIGQTDLTTRLALVDTGTWTDAAEGLVVPAVSQDEWDDLTVAIGGLEPDGTASVVLYIEDDNGPVPGAEVVAPAGTGQAPYYDNGAADNWDQVGLTGSFGAAIVLDVPAVASPVTFGILVDTESFEVAVPVAPDTLTFARAVIGR